MRLLFEGGVYSKKYRVCVFASSCACTCADNVIEGCMFVGVGTQHVNKHTRTNNLQRLF